MDFNDLIKNIIKKLIKNIIKKTLRIDFDKINSTVDDELSRDNNNMIIAEDYYHLIKSVLKLKQIYNIQLSRDDTSKITIDGTEYCFDELVRHNDLKNTERIMEIEALFADGASFDEVQRYLNQKLISG